MDAKTIMKTTICLEHNDEFNYKWFHYKPKTFVHHVDTLYFLATTRTDDWNKDRRADDFIREIKLKKEQSERLPTVLLQLLLCISTLHNGFRHIFFARDNVT